MKLELVNFEQAKALKALGFPQYEYMEYYDDGYCTSTYERYAKPSLELAAKWLREEKKYDINVSPVWQDNFDPDRIEYRFCITHKAKIIYGDTIHYLVYNTYEEALSKGIDKVIEFLKGK